MRVLIVEDNAFNAFCLTRLIEVVYKQAHVVVLNNSLNVLNFLAQNDTSIVILDGDLGASDGLHCNGPALAELIWMAKPQLPIVAWSDSDSMRSAFAEVFKQHSKPFNDHSCWTKIVSLERIYHSLPYVLTQNMSNHFSEAPRMVDRYESLHS